MDADQSGMARLQSMEKTMSKVAFFPFELYHGRKNVGSTGIRVHNLLKYWPEASTYKYGGKYDAIIFQKVYMAPDFRFHEMYKGIKILDICDPDWLDGLMITQTINNVDAVTCPTEEIAKFIRQLTDKPVRVIPDRHDVAEVPKPKTHRGEAKRVVWFGYKQNSELLRFAVPYLELHGLYLTVISNEDPLANRWANDPELYMNKYTFTKYNASTIYEDLAKHDICLLPEGNRPQDRFKSNNKTTKAWLAGLPVANTAEDLKKFKSAEARNKEVETCYNEAIKNYDCKLSVKDMKDLIEELKHAEH